MPTRTYKCPNCGFFDKELNVHDDEITHCPYCNNAVKREYKPINCKFNCDGAYGKSSK
jgi:putative FmdB family regulatory protein